MKFPSRKVLAECSGTASFCGGCPSGRRTPSPGPLGPGSTTWAGTGAGRGDRRSLQAQGQDRRRNRRDDRAAAAAPEDRDVPRDLRPGASRAHPAPGLRPLEGAKLIVGENGRAQVRTPVTNAHLVCRLLFAKKKPT